VGRHEIACRRCHTLHVAQISKNFKKQQNTQDQKQWPETSAEQLSSCPVVVADITSDDADSLCIHIHCLLTNMDINISLNTTKAIVNDTV